VIPERPLERLRWRRVERRERESALGPADPEQLALAAEELRERTMSLEEIRSGPSAQLMISILVGVFVVAALLLVYRAELRALLAAARL
jgi:hypothetical protein